MDEFALYEEIKKTFSVEKGKVLMIEVTSAKVTELVPLTLNTFDDFALQVRTWDREKRVYIVLDYLSDEEPLCVFQGKTFMKVQNLATGEVLEFAMRSEKPVSIEDVKRDLAKLELLLRNTKAS